jgi:hypothetical protein
VIVDAAQWFSADAGADAGESAASDDNFGTLRVRPAIPLI